MECISFSWEDSFVKKITMQDLKKLCLGILLIIQKNKKKCFDCDKLIDGLYYTDNLNRTFCEADYKVKSQQML